jgi:acyl-coenzyme A thioesterase PaaI-like protein
MASVTTEVQTPTGGGFATAFEGIDPAKPDYDRIRQIAAGIVPFGDHANVRVTQIGPDCAVVEIPDEPHLGNHMGTVHAGALFLAADIAGAAAFLGAAATGLHMVQRFVLRDARTAFRKPAIGRIRAVGTVDERDMRALLAAEGERRFEVDGKALMYDDSGVLVAKATFDYVCDVHGGAGRER